jgi:hypothetical protein
MLLDVFVFRDLTESNANPNGKETSLEDLGNLTNNFSVKICSTQSEIMKPTSKYDTMSENQNTKQQKEIHKDVRY